MKRVIVDISAAVPAAGIASHSGIGITPFELVHVLDRRCASDYKHIFRLAFAAAPEIQSGFGQRHYAKS